MAFSNMAYYTERNELGYVGRFEYATFFRWNLCNANESFKIVYVQLCAHSI